MAAKISFTLPNGAKLPGLGLGTFEARDEQELVDALNAALENGYRHIDTAYLYENEKIIGKVLKTWFDSGKVKREDLFITTKLPLTGVHPDRVEYFMKESLANLQLSYVDLYLIHYPVGLKYEVGKPRGIVTDKGTLELEGRTDHAAIWKKMEEQVDLGRTKSIGLSNYNISQIQTILNSARIHPANLQIEIHVYLQQHDLIDFCHKNNITVVAYAPLGAPGFNKVLKRVGYSEKPLPNILGDATIAKIAQKHGKTPAQIAIRFLLQKGVCPIPKTVTLKRIQENINVFDFILDDEDLKALTALHVGEEARVFDGLTHPGLSKHPDYPLGKKA